MCADVVHLCKAHPAAARAHVEEAVRVLNTHRDALEDILQVPHAAAPAAEPSPEANVTPAKWGDEVEQEGAAPPPKPLSWGDEVEEEGSTKLSSWADEAVSPPRAGAGAGAGPFPPQPRAAAWQEKRNWGAILTPPGPLYAKFLSPERMRKTPQETKRIAMAKQARAEALRGQQLDARIARATARRDSQGQSARQTEEEKQQQQERLRMELDERDRRKHELRRAHIDAIAQRAGDENRKVEEVAFLARLEEENKRLRTQQKLEDAQERRARLEEERRQRAIVDSASEEASERRQRLEEELRQRIAVKAGKREEAAQKLEDERKAAREAAETRAEEARLAAEAHAAREAQLAEERSQKLRRRLLEAEQRRKQYITDVRSTAVTSRGSMSGGESPGTPPTPSTSSAASTHAPGSPMRSPMASLSDASAAQPQPPDSPSRAANRASAEAEAAIARLKSQKKRMRKLRARSDALASALAPRLAAHDACEAASLVADVAADLDKSSGPARTLERLKRHLSELRRGRMSAADEAAVELARALKYCSPKSADQLRLLHAARAGDLLRWLAETLASPALAPEKAMERAKLLRTCCSLPGNCIYLIAHNLLAPVLPALVGCLDQYNATSDTILEGDDVDEASAAAFLASEELLHELLSLFARALRPIGGAAAGSNVDGAAEPSYPDAAFMEAEVLATLQLEGLHQMESDLVSAVVAAGVVHRLHDTFVLSVKPGLPATENGAGDATPALAPIPAVVQDGLTLMEVLAVPRGPARMDHAPGKEAEGCAKVVLDAMAETAFAGLPSLLTTVLLHATPKDAKDAVATLPPNFAPAAAAVCRVLCDLSRLQQAKELFHSPDLRIELYHLLSFLLAFCTRADGSSAADVANPKQQAIHTLRNAAVVLVGWFARLSKECQDMLVWGSGNQTPTILSRLASLPYPYTCDPTLRAVLMPTLIAACFRHPSNVKALEANGMSARMLSQYLAEEASTEEDGGPSREPHAVLGISPPPRAPEHLTLRARFPRTLWREAGDAFSGIAMISSAAAAGTTAA